MLSQPRESSWGTTQRDQKEGLEFGFKEYSEINKYCNSKGIDWFASAWDLESLEFCKQFNFRYNKIASAMIVDLNFVEKVAMQKKYTFISTGMSTLDDISRAVDIFRKNKTPFELMHCVSTYPAKIEDLNLDTIYALKERYKTNVGYSGHENGTVVSVSAVLYGISSLERHITLDRTMYGSDQAASIEFKGMKNLTDSIFKVIAARGEKKLGFSTDEEMQVAKKLRAHIVN